MKHVHRSVLLRDTHTRELSTDRNATVQTLLHGRLLYPARCLVLEIQEKSAVMVMLFPSCKSLLQAQVLVPAQRQQQQQPAPLQPNW